MNLPIFIAENLFKLCKKENSSEYITVESLFDILKKTFIFSSIENDISNKLKFFIDYFLQLSGTNDLYENDFQLVFYHFHMISNKSKRNISKIDEIVHNFFGKNKDRNNNTTSKIQSEEVYNDFESEL